MTSYNLEDENFKNLGYITTEGKRAVLYKKGGYCLGFYDSETDTTHKTGGKLIGKGNLLALLLLK